MPWPDPNAATYPRQPNEVRAAAVRAKNWWQQTAYPSLQQFANTGLLGERAAAMRQTTSPEPGVIGMGQYQPLPSTAGAAGLAGLGGPLVTPQQAAPLEQYGPPPSYGPARPSQVLQSPVSPAPPAAQKSVLEAASGGLSALAPAIGGALTANHPMDSGTTPQMTRGGLGLSGFDQADALATPAATQAPAYAAPSTPGNFPVGALGGTTAFGAPDKPSASIEPDQTPEERKSEDRRTAIAAGLLKFAQSAASGKGWQGIAEGIPAGGLAGLTTWTSSQDAAEKTKRQDTQQNFANTMATRSLDAQMANASATREQTGAYNRERTDMARQAAGETAAERATRLQIERERMAQQGSQFGQTLAQRQAEIAAGKGVNQPAVLQTIKAMMDANPGMDFNAAYDRTTQLGTKPDRDILSGMYTKLAADPMNMGKSPAELAGMARQALQALDMPGGSAASAAGRVYKGDQAPLGVTGAKRLPDGRWAAPGPDGNLYEVIQ